MQRLFVILVLFSSSFASAQVYNNTINTNSTNALPDSVKPQLELKKAIGEEKSQQKPQPKKSEKTSYKKDAVAEKEVQIDSPAASQQMQQQFESNKYSSSRKTYSRSASPVEQMNMDASVQYYKKQNPDSFEAHFYAYLAGHYNVALVGELEAAAKLQPENQEVIRQQAAYHIISYDNVSAVTSIEKLVAAGAIAQGQLAYARDALLSTSSNGVLLLHGFDDMYPVYYVQQKEGLRPDVTLLSLDFMQSALYRQNISTFIHIPSSTVIDTDYLRRFCELNADRKPQLSLTIPKDYFTGIKDRLYPVGLTFEYAATPVNTFEVNNELWYTTLQKALVAGPANDSSDKWTANYLPMMITLKAQLEQQGKTAEVQELNARILAVGARTQNTDKVKKYAK